MIEDKRQDLWVFVGQTMLWEILKILKYSPFSVMSCASLSILPMTNPCPLENVIMATPSETSWII
jgi:hypothetical protein